MRKFILQKEVKPGIWKATATLSMTRGINMPSEECNIVLLLKEVKAGGKGLTLTPYLDSKVMPSTVNGKTILHIMNPLPAEVKKLEEGAEVEIPKFGFVLNRKSNKS